MVFLLQHLLARSATRYPNRAALRFEGAELNYSELDLISNQLAHVLLEAGVKRGDRVGIFLHKSLATVISMFGVLKAGGTFVPLDPKAPVRRLAYITRNCDVRVLVTASGKLQRAADFFVEGTPIQTIVLTDNGESKSGLPSDVQVKQWSEVCAQPLGPPPPAGTIESDLAYILYTSGSTGDPKGVMISHRTILTFVNWACEEFGLSGTDRVTSHAPIHFDLSTFDIYATIKAGGTVVLVPETHSVFPIQLVKLLQDEKITVTYMVPSIYTLMVNHGRLVDHDLSALRLVLFAGEVFPLRYLRELVRTVPHAEFFNLYGPTETNVCTYYKVQRHDLEPDRSKPVPIGRACENMEVFACDLDGNLVSEPGQEGELWVRGPCVAQGYWGDKEKTARVFVQNSHQPFVQEIAYRTGDIVTLDGDGVNWHYLGRRDHMVKSRGYRIELGEIEVALYRHSSVKEAAVVAVPDEVIGHRIKAFVVQGEDQAVTSRAIQAFCRESLPDYMVPETVEFCEELPKTSTGKVNRTLLVNGSSAESPVAESTEEMQHAN